MYFNLYLITKHPILESFHWVVLSGFGLKKVLQEYLLRFL